MQRRTPEETLPLLVADVFEAAGMLRRAGDALAGRVGQTQSRWQLLIVVSEGDWTAAAAARRLGISRQAVQKVANALAHDGLIDFEANPTHRRAPLLRVTPTGRQALATITASTRTWHTRMSDGLSTEDLESARSLLRTLSARAIPAVEADTEYWQGESDERLQH
jgi:DNA-binding MarR family transcriptional regulator